MEKSRLRLVFSGSGGQGVITAAIIMAEAAVLYDGMNAVQSQVYGPEARGGSTRSDVILSDSVIYFPKVTQPNILVCLTQESYNKYFNIIRPGGLLITDSKFVTQIRKADARQFSLNMFDSVMERIGRPIVFNICMLGTVIGITEIIRPESIMEILKSRIPPDFIEMNQNALEIGISIGKEYKD